MTPTPRPITAAIAFLCTLCLLLAPRAALHAQDDGAISLTALQTAHTEPFDALAVSGFSAELPAGWALVETGTGAAADGRYRAALPTSAAGDTYSFGANGSSERSLGALRSNSVAPLFGAHFTNHTGATLDSLAIAYTGEQWRLGTPGRGPDRLDFQLSTDAASLTSGAWQDYDALDFASPVVSGSAGVLDGNAAPARIAISFTITGLSIPDGASFWVRWIDADAPGADDGLAIDDFSLAPLGIVPDDAPAITSTFPAGGAQGVPLDATLALTFTEPVTTTGAWVSLTCATGGAMTAAVSGGPAAFTVDPAGDLAPGETCTLTILAANVADQDANDPPDNPAADLSVVFTAASPVATVCSEPYTPIHQIQGSGEATPLAGTVTTQGVVVGDFEGPSPALRGFYLQDAGGDGDPATSDGLFVFNGSNAGSVTLGELVRITGTVSENQGQTQVSVNPSNIFKCGPGSVQPVDVTLPLASPTALEAYEGMLVRFPQTLYVTEHFQLGRFGQVVLSSGARLPQPTNRAAPGPEAQALQAANNLNRIIVDDATQAQNPDPILIARGGQPLSAANTLRGGDTVTGLAGVLSYTWGGNVASPNAYRLRLGSTLGESAVFEPANPRPASAPAPSGRLRVGGMNLLNFFNTFAGNCRLGVGGAPTDCRGANNLAEFNRQWPKTVAAITGTGADVLGLVEIENDGYGPGSALQFLVDQLNAATAPNTYALIDVDAATGQSNTLGTDAIKVGMIYKPAMVTPVGQTAALNSVEFVNGGDSAPRNRPALAQAFQENATGERFVVAVNHLKSKGSACDAPDSGDGQGNCAAVRTTAANLLAQWLAADPTGAANPDLLILGDLNAYAQESPIAALRDAGYADLVAAFHGPDAYSFAFDGQWGYLDYALANAALAPQVAGVADWHINADEPVVLDYNTDFKSAAQQQSLYAPGEFRIADHDPVLVDLTLAGAEPLASPGALPRTGSTPSAAPLLVAALLTLLALAVAARSSRALAKRSLRWR